jgi:hypothetical protein
MNSDSGNPATKPEEGGGVGISLSELHAQALKHYDEVSTAAGSWLSTIPRAIDFYFNYKLSQEAEPTPRPPEGWCELDNHLHPQRSSCKNWKPAPVVS